MAEKVVQVQMWKMGWKNPTKPIYWHSLICGGGGYEMIEASSYIKYVTSIEDSVIIIQIQTIQ